MTKRGAPAGNKRAQRGAEPRSELLQIRCTPAEKEAITQAAGDKGYGRFMVDKIMEMIKGK